MKKFFIALVSVLIISTTYSTVNPPCWIQPTVEWTDNCTVGYVNFHYKVVLNVYDYCDPNATNPVFTDTKTAMLPTTSLDFCITETLCTENGEEKCYRVVASVEKWDGQPSDPGDLICRGYTLLDVNCEELLALDGETISVVINP